jgi:hypothetical protein
MQRKPAMPHPSPLSPCTLDIEASGFGRHSYPIEVGYVLPNGNAKCMLVRPEAAWTHWDLSAEQVHRITRTSLLELGRPVHEVASALNRDLAGLTVYCDGWAHDYTWLGALFEAADLSPHFKLQAASQLLNQHQLPQLDDQQRQARAALDLQRHRASSDALVLQTALCALLNADTRPVPSA